MTDSDSPSALLERAADKLVDLASEATPGPWWTHVIRGDVYSGEEEFGEGHLIATRCDEEDGDWIAAMSPAVAHPLVEWLRETVEQYRTEHSRRTVPAEALDEAWMRHPAVRFAQQVLGEPSNVP